MGKILDMLVEAFVIAFGAILGLLILANYFVATAVYAARYGRK